MRWAGRTPGGLLLLCAALCLACARRSGPTQDSRNAVATKWHYKIRLGQQLDRLDAEVCFAGATPQELRPGKSEGAERLEYVRWLRPGPVRRLPVVRGRIQIEPRTPNGCVGYGVKLTEGGSWGSSVRRVGRDLLASPNIWLWRPERRARTAHATLELELPDGIEVLLPWPEEHGVRVLDDGAFRFESYAAFGHFRPVQGSYRGVAIDVAALDGRLALDGAGALRWIEGAVDVLAQSGTPFPARHVAAILVPSKGYGEPVPFGMVARGGGASLLLLVSSAAGEDELRRDWVLPHELSHLLLPFIEREQAWLSEGLATYFQELLRARAGVLEERSALYRIAQALREAAGHQGDTSIVAESARMHETHAYRRVYWGGAAYWMMADVELRRRSHGHMSLDTLLDALQREGALDQVWTAHALLQRLDALSQSLIFSQAADAARQRAFPDFEPTLAALGVRLDDDGVQLDDAAPLAEIRRALFAPRR